ncbi:hypothetical protein BVX93_02115 [bacterium B13(2017)]|nr:hypothetical protein BVX93_02115 [bacterium B13(2017)]
MKILVVDDSFTMRRIIKKHLYKIGFKDIIEASDGEDALNKFSGVDLVLTDWNMPNINGISFVKKIRSNSDYNNIKIIMVTTESSKAEVAEAIKYGVNNYVIKPFTHEILKEKIEQVVKKV